MFVSILITYIYHMQNKVSKNTLFKRTRKGFDKFMRKIINKANRVCTENFFSIIKPNISSCCIKGCK